MAMHRATPFDGFKRYLNKTHAIPQLYIPLSPKPAGDAMLETTLPLLLSDTKLRRGRLDAILQALYG
jgi:hypothetical protein